MVGRKREKVQKKWGTRFLEGLEKVRRCSGFGQAGLGRSRFRLRVEGRTHPGFLEFTGQAMAAIEAQRGARAMQRFRAGQTRALTLPAPCRGADASGVSRVYRAGNGGDKGAV